MKIYSPKNLVKYKIYFKNPEKPSCIDQIITNYSQSFLKQ